MARNPCGSVTAAAHAKAVGQGQGPWVRDGPRTTPRFRDGSTGDIADGYWLRQVIGVENEEAAIWEIPVKIIARLIP